MKRLGRTNEREWLFREAHEMADDEVHGMRWEFDHAAETWRSAELQADGNACSACGEDLGHPQYHDPHRCECVARAHREAVQQHITKYKAKTVLVEWSQASIPDRYERARFENFEHRDGTEVALSTAEAWAESFECVQGQPGLLLVGGFGAGKTHLAVAAAYRALERTLVRPHFVSAAGLIRATKGGDQLNHEPARKAIAAELLVLDDVGQVGRTDYDRELLFSIVAERYDEGAPMLCTSNLPPDRLGDLLGGAFASRLHEACRIAFLTASDFRKEKGVR